MYLYDVINTYLFQPLKKIDPNQSIFSHIWLNLFQKVD